MIQITLDLKAKLRRKNKLMRTGRVEEASVTMPYTLCTGPLLLANSFMQ